MSSILFGKATFSISPNIQKVRGPKEAEQLEKIVPDAAKQLDDLDIKLEFDAKNPTDFEVDESVFVKATLNPSLSIMDQKDTTVHRVMAANPFVLPLVWAGVAVSGVISIFTPASREFTKLMFKYGKQVRTEPMKHFVDRAMKEIRTEFTDKK